jgi:hypothetical protein
VVGVAVQTPGLGPVRLGGQWTVLQQYEDLWWRNRTLFTLNLIVSGVLGGLCFFIWLMRREQRAFGWYALMALFWVLFIANVLVTSPWPFPDSLTAARANIMVLVTSPCRASRRRYGCWRPCCWRRWPSCRRGICRKCS